jgi:beta-lactamase regulating signal transducer with metallopeptidase domain
VTTFDALSVHFAAPTVAPALAWLARTSIDAALVAVLVVVVQTAFGRWLTPGWRYRLWGLVVLRLVLPVLPASPTSLWNLRVAAPVRGLIASSDETRAVPPALVPPAVPAAHPGLTVKVFVEPLDPAAALPAPSMAVPAPPKLPTPQPAPPPDPAPTPSRLPLVLAAVWLAGAALLLCRHIISNMAFARRLRRARAVTDPALLEMLADCGQAMGVSCLPPVLVTDAVCGPAVAGVCRRRILLPPGLFEGLAPAERRTVLLHELAHVRCADVAANWLLAVLQAVHWFNPFLWLAFARLRADRELARDAMVLSVANTVDDEDAARGTAAERYAQTLLRLTERLSARPGLPPTAAAAVAGVAGVIKESPPSSSLIPGLFGGRTALQRRLRMITRLPASTSRFTFVGPALLLALGCGTLTRPTSGGEPGAGAAPQKPATQPEASGAERRAEDPDLHAKVQLLVEKQQYKEALALAEEALRADPGNGYALAVRPLLQDKVALDAQRAGKAKPESPEDTDAFQAKLDRKLPEVNLEGMPLADVIEFLRDTGGVNIFVNWKALEAAGIDRKEPVTARMRNVRFSKALQVVLESASSQAAHIGYSADDGVVTVSTADDLAKNTLTRVYDIRDLLVMTPDFIPGEGLLGLSPTTKPSEPRPDQPGDKRDEELRKTRAALVNDVVQLITETVATDTWKDNGGSTGSVRELSGQLIVTQTPENHLELVRLLEQLRETKGVQVTVEARFVTCDEEVVRRLLKEWGKAAPGTANPATSSDSPSGRDKGRVPTGIFLDDQQVDQLFRAAQAEKESAVISAPRMTLFSGQRAYVLVSSEQAYVQDYAAIAKGGEVRYEPVMGVAQDGLLTDMQATVSADRRYATLMIHPKLTKLVGMNSLPWPGRPAGSNLTVQVPDMKTTEMRTTVSVPDGGTILLGGLEYPGAAAAGPTTAPSTRPAATQPSRNMLLLVKPKLVLQRERVRKEFPTVRPATTRPAE